MVSGRVSVWLQQLCSVPCVSVGSINQGSVLKEVSLLLLQRDEVLIGPSAGEGKFHYLSFNEREILRVSGYERDSSLNPACLSCVPARRRRRRCRMLIASGHAQSVREH